VSAATIAKAALAAWEARDLDKTASLLADNFVLTGPAPEPLSKAAFLTFQKVHNDALPTGHSTPETFRSKASTNYDSNHRYPYRRL